MCVFNIVCSDLYLPFCLLYRAAAAQPKAGQDINNAILTELSPKFECKLHFEVQILV
jgi:hypothetical protein